jgi:hypothetical protein
MTGARIAIESIEIDPAYTVSTKVRYKVTLKCGCSWWEDRSPDDRQSEWMRCVTGRNTPATRHRPRGLGQQGRLGTRTSARGQDEPHFAYRRDRDDDRAVVSIC